MVCDFSISESNFYGTTNGENFTLLSEQQAFLKFHVDNANEFELQTGVYKSQLSDNSWQITLSNEKIQSPILKGIVIFTIVLPVIIFIYFIIKRINQMDPKEYFSEYTSKEDKKQ